MSSTVETNNANNDDYNQKILSKSTWITKEFLEPILRKKEKDDDIIIDDIHICAAVGAGDNYLSFLFRTIVDFKRGKSGEMEHMHLMIKGAPTNEYMLKFIEEFGVFKKEIAMYNDCLPAMKKIQDEFFPANTEFVGAESFSCSLPNTIIMEDLQHKGYKMANRMEQINYECCLNALKTLARFHALSVKVQERYPDIIRAVSRECYTEDNRVTMGNMLNSCIPLFSETLAGHLGTTDILEKFEPIGKNAYDKMMEVVKASDSGLNVLNHGDLWVNNMLFKYNDDGLIKDVKLIDFQLSRYASPALDLHYFLFTSPKPQVLSERWDDMIQGYHHALASDLHQLKISEDKIPTLEDIHGYLLDKAFFGVITCSTLLPVMLASPDDAVDMDTIKEEDLTEMNSPDNPFLKYYKNPYYKQTAVKSVRHLEKMGLLEAARTLMQHIDDRLG